MTMVVAGIEVCKKQLDVSVDGVDRLVENDRSDWGIPRFPAHALRQPGGDGSDRTLSPLHPPVPA